MRVLIVWRFYFYYLSVLQLLEIFKGLCVHFLGCSGLFMVVCVPCCLGGGLCSFSLCLLEIFFQFCSAFLVLTCLFCSSLFAVEPCVVLSSVSGFALVLLFHNCLGCSISSDFLRNFRIKAEHAQRNGNPSIKEENARNSGEFQC